ncbi:hypothetical protein SAMN02745133_03053, partial [Desulforamulus putei DSM 12395]
GSFYTGRIMVEAQYHFFKVNLISAFGNGLRRITIVRFMLL